MDEIDELKSLKKGILFVFIGLTAYILFVSIINIPIEGFSYKNIESYIIIYFNNILIFELPLIIVYLVKKYILIRNRKIFDINTVSKIIREISKEYSPAICSAVYNNKVESYSDYTATILYLEKKKYVKIYSKKEQYSIEILNNDTEKLNIHEKYVLDCLKSIKNFSTSVFEDNVIKDMIDLNLAKVTKRHINKYCISFIIIIAFLTILICYGYGADSARGIWKRIERI